MLSFIAQKGVASLGWQSTWVTVTGEWATEAQGLNNRLGDGRLGDSLWAKSCTHTSWPLVGLCSNVRKCRAYNSVFLGTKCAVGNSECVVGICLMCSSICNNEVV